MSLTFATIAAIVMAGTLPRLCASEQKPWMPAFAGMTRRRALRVGFNAAQAPRDIPPDQLCAFAFHADYPPGTALTRRQEGLHQTL